MNFKLRGNFFWQGSQICLLCDHGISWEKRIVLKEFFCSQFRIFSVENSDLRQAISAGSQNCWIFIQRIFWRTLFGEIYSRIFVLKYAAKKLYVFGKFLRLIFKSALYNSKRIISESFVFFMKTWIPKQKLLLKQIKISVFSQSFQHGFITPLYMTKGKICEKQFPSEKFTFFKLQSSLKEKILVGRWKLQTTSPDKFLRKTNAIGENFAVKFGRWA